jgi:hypothetical protein
VGSSNELLTIGRPDLLGILTNLTAHEDERDHDRSRTHDFSEVGPF